MDSAEIASLLGTSKSNLYIRRVAADQAGPVALKLSMTSGRAFITVSPDIHRAEVVLAVENASSAAREAVDAARVDSSGSILTVDTTTSGTTVSYSRGYNSGYQIIVDQVVVIGGTNSGQIRVGGMDVTSATTTTNGLLLAGVLLPDGSRVDVDSAAADVSLRGRVQGARVKTMSGNVNSYEELSDAKIQTMSGNVHIEKLLEGATVSTMSGNITVLGLDSSGALPSLSTMSGSITVKSVSKSRWR